MKLEYHKLLSTSDFNFMLRRYSEEFFRLKKVQAKKKKDMVGLKPRSKVETRVKSA